MRGDGTPVLSAFLELVNDREHLADEEAMQSVPSVGWAAVLVQLERSNDGDSTCDVHLKELAGTQLRFVLAVAAKHGLDAREEAGWLRLRLPMKIVSQPEPEPAEATS